MSPTRRRRARLTRNQLIIGTATLAVVASTVVLTRTVASADAGTAQAGPTCSASASVGAAGAGAVSTAAAAPASQKLSPGARWLARRGVTIDSHGAHNYWGDGQDPTASGGSTAASTPAPASTPVSTPASNPGATGSSSQPVGSGSGDCAPGAATSSATAGGSATGSASQPGSPTTSGADLQILGNSCQSSTLPPHTGFQDGDRCVSTQFGEVGTADKNPSLLITSAPRVVRVNQFFDLKVSTRNLVRDRFLKAAAGGYYKESSFLTADGLVRGHFHTACRMLATTTEAPDPTPAPAFFVATEDGKGGAQPDTVTIRVLGLPQRGIAQCAVWAGDGSHRVPMMQRANQIPAFDVVRILVR